MIPSGNRDRLVNCIEEFIKYTIVMRPRFELFGDYSSERKERKAKLASQAAAKNGKDRAEAEEADN